MLAPIDKVTKGGNDIIQMVITRSCNTYNCSNCSQLLPFRKDAKEMSLECIEEALLSVQGWPGVVACFGGNPCTHSRFPEVCSLWEQYLPDQRQRGLWTNDLMKHGEVVRKTFWPKGRFNLNVHHDRDAAEKMRQWLPGVPIYGESGRVHHATMLMDYHDYEITDEEWTLLRESCDINRRWSSGIYQGGDGRPYAYFCEVAGALSGVRGEDNGILATPGWWKLPMEAFQSQVGTCCNRGCGVPLKARGHQDTEDTYDISMSWVGLTDKRSGKVVLECHTVRPETVHENTDYIGHKLKRG